MKRHPDAFQLNEDSGQLSGQSSGEATRRRSRGAGTLTRLNSRDEELLATLVHRVRCLDVTLASEFWLPNPVAPLAAMRRLIELSKAGWLSEHRAFARPLIDLNAPLIIWKPGDPAPDFGSISYHLKNRFTEPAKGVRVYVATAKTEKRFGGKAGRRPRSSEVTHDLGLAAVYLRMRRESPARARRWTSEAKIVSTGHARGVKVPDAIVQGQSGRSVAIEFGGEYGKRKLESFHEYCAAKDMEYEIW